MQPVKGIYLSGVGGKIPVKGCGTARFYITDDMGRKTSVRIDGAYFAPQSPLNLLCPQQWATQRNSKYGVADDARFTVMPEESKLSWSAGKQTKTIRYNSSNIPVLHTASGFTKFSAFVCGIINSPEIVAFPMEISESSESDSDDSDDSSTVNSSTNKKNEGESEPRSFDEHTFFPFDDDVTKHSVAPPAIVDDPTLPEDQCTLLEWHYRLNHASFKHIKYLSALPF
jgi:hypothetical protein